MPATVRSVKSLAIDKSIGLVKARMTEAIPFKSFAAVATLHHSIYFPRLLSVPFSCRSSLI